MGYSSLQACVRDLEQSRQLVRVDAEIDPHLEMAEIQRRLYAAGGPAVLFTRPRGCKFPMLANLFGTIERTRYLFRDSLDGVRKLVELKVDPERAKRQPWRYWKLPATLWSMQPKRTSTSPAFACSARVGELPRLVCWPNDGGHFVTLPLVYSEHPDQPGLMKSNLGMYRVQLGGNQYRPDREIGLHYQIHRGIGVHHAAAIARGERLRVNIFVGGPPAMTVSAVMPLPEGLSELMFAGALGGRRIRMAPTPGGLPAWADADFIISGSIDPSRTLPEGPFGDHLGYYAKVHDFPVLEVDQVWHRKDAIWPFTVVGRPPQEDTSFGEFIHEITGPIIPTVIAGVKEVHAVDAAGVHPLLLAIGSERYVPYARDRRPQELLTQANAILGQGQLSLAKYLWIAAHEDDPQVNAHDISAFFRHVLRRVDWERDLHFQTRTTMDTLDYSGSGFNSGSKLVVAVAGPVRRELPAEISFDGSLPEGFRNPRVCLPGVLAVEGPPAQPMQPEGDVDLARFCDAFSPSHPINAFPLIVIVDDSAFIAATLNNFLWTTFTRSNPAADVDGIGRFVEQKHWGCRGSLVIDARVKPHHAPPLIEDPAVSKQVDQLAAPGGPLHGLLG